MNIDLTHLLFDIENQGSMPYCARFAATSYLEAIWRKFDPDNAQEMSVAFLVWITNEAEGKFGGANDGTNGATVMNCLKKYGCCTEKTWPSTPENFGRRPSPEAFAEAKRFRIQKWEQVKTPADGRRWLEKGLPFLFNIKVPSGADRIKGPRATHPAQWRALGRGSIASGHIMAGFGCTLIDIDAVNSWGPDWGDAGTTRIGDETLALLLFRGYVITKIRKGWMGKIRDLFKGWF